ncbi:Uncharacterised protein [Candidatus Venteria ishoeyi]|uniref:Uncharacterized protein n=2 Tax=Candidatus Venteria ishoeyi TaxID=1899563 RepID=A0A1H6F8E0_9GAMM|nr:Uncharacterised protein [Candidatus Venteria ishoeyi]
MVTTTMETEYMEQIAALNRQLGSVMQQLECQTREAQKQRERANELADWKRRHEIDVKEK